MVGHSIPSSYQPTRFLREIQVWGKVWLKNTLYCYEAMNTNADWATRSTSLSTRPGSWVQSETKQDLMELSWEQNSHVPRLLFVEKL